MNGAKNLLYLPIILLLLILFFFTIPKLDWGRDWMLPVLFTAAFFSLIMAIIETKKIFLFLLFIFPAGLYFNDYKADVSQYLPFLNDYNIPLNFTAVICSLLIVFSLVSIMTEWRKIKKAPLFSIIFFYAAYTAISAFWSEDKGQIFTGIIYFLTPFFVYLFAFVNFKKEKDTIAIALVAVGSSFIPLLLAFYQIYASDYFFEPDSYLERLRGPFVHPNLFGLHLFVIISLLISFFIAKQEQKITKNKTILLCLTASFAIFILTYSRISWACLAIFLIIISLVKKNILFASIVASPVAAYLALSMSEIKIRLTEMFSNTIFSSWIARKNIWEVSMGEITQKPIFGHGVGSAESVIEKAKDWQGGTSLPHNDFILYLLELGITGVLIFLAFTGGAVYYLKKTFKTLANKNTAVKILGKNTEINLKTFAYGIMAMFLAILLASIFESASRRITEQIIIWALLGSLFRLAKTPESNLEQR